MHDGTFLGLPGVHRAEVVGIGPDGRTQVRVAALGEGLHWALSLVPVPAAALGRVAAVTMMDDQPLILGLVQPLRAEVEADGEKLVIEAGREMVLRCGKASITMTADGRVTIRGTQVLSRSEGPNRVQGASVQLN
ncbi:hypothetical protein [Tabrizicola sp.]|uniref:hypothetical protein n=1 Tax=Tabrizicola sp. TaxID=2005166 RepID=UPI0035AF0C10